ncbi:HAD-IA family hydrolase [Candidatus Micrarchaeota archaeon]|nr:HAD-IA family hydrolase [Candidatus Micrarchaeota archaeon]
MQGPPVNHLRWLISLAVFAAFFLAFPATGENDLPILAIGAIVAYFLSFPACRWFKKTFYRPIILFDLHNVIIAGDFELDDLYELPATRQLVRRVRRHYFTGALTNFSNELLDFYNRKFGLFAEFDAVYNSGMFHVRKPHAKFFERVLRDLGVVAGDVIFIDDREENVAAARKLGFRSIVFANAAQLDADLKKMGIRTR